jgi:hypothetical protein
MTWIGDNSIEIGSPYGEGSSVATFVERLGGGMHSVAVQVDDLPTTLARIEALGVEVAVRLAPDLAFTRPGGTVGLVFEWGSHVQEDDPRFGAPVPEFVVEPLVNVARMAFVAALVRDPERDAARLAEVLDTDRIDYLHGGSPDRVHHALDLGDCLLALYPVPPDDATSQQVWAGAYDRPRCIALGLLVDDLGSAEALLADAGVAVHHRTGDGHVILVDHLPFPVVLTDRLLGGDPRTAE